MLLELILAFLVGILAGIITGLIPGIHINLIATLIVFSSLTLNIPVIAFIVFITSMAITSAFMDFIPSIFLAAPDEGTALSVLPGHQFLLQGQGHHALKLALTGSMFSIILLIIIIPLFILIIPKAYPFMQRMMGFFLIWIVILMILGERNNNLKCLLIFILAGFLGLSTLNLNLNQPLLPMLTGLFGASTLITSIKTKTKIPKQNTKKIPISKEDLVRPLLITSFVSPLASIFPGLGNSEAAVIGSRIGGKLSREQFLVLLGSINTLVVSISFLALYLLQKTRTGAAAAINQITPIEIPELLIILLTIFLTAIIAYPLTLKTSKIFASNIHKVSYTKISALILIFISVIVILISGPLGFLVFTVATLLGITAIEFNIRRAFLMGCLLVPTILFYLPL